MEIATCSQSLRSLNKAEVDGNIHPDLLETSEEKSTVSPTSYKTDQEYAETVINVAEKIKVEKEADDGNLDDESMTLLIGKENTELQCSIEIDKTDKVKSDNDRVYDEDGQPEICRKEVDPVDSRVVINMLSESDLSTSAHNNSKEDLSCDFNGEEYIRNDVKKSLCFNLCGGRCWKSEFYNKWIKPEFNIFTLLAGIVSIMMFYFDVISDVVLAVEYFRQNRWMEFGLTATFIIIPLLVMNALNLYWYKLDSLVPVKIQYLRRLASFPFMSGLVFRSCEEMYHGYKKKFPLKTPKFIDVDALCQLDKKWKMIRFTGNCIIHEHLEDLEEFVHIADKTLDYRMAYQQEFVHIEDKTLDNNMAYKQDRMVMNIKHFICKCSSSLEEDRNNFLNYGYSKERIQAVEDSFKKFKELLKLNDNTLLKHFIKFKKFRTGVSTLKMVEAFLEAAPQLLLQMYIILTETTEEELSTYIIRRTAMVGSWIGVTVSVLSFNISLIKREDSFGREVQKTRKIFNYLWRACEIGTRLVSLALFAAAFHYYMLIGVAVHWIIMIIWLMYYIKRYYVGIDLPLITIPRFSPRYFTAYFINKFHGMKNKKLLTSIVIGYFNIFSFQEAYNRRPRTRYKYIVLCHYCLTFAENIAMLLTWYFYTPLKDEWYHDKVIILVPVGMVLQVVFHRIDYFLRPSFDSMTVSSYLEQMTRGYTADDIYWFFDQRWIDEDEEEEEKEKEEEEEKLFMDQLEAQ